MTWMLSALCLECLSWNNGPFYVLPSELTQKYHLHRLDELEVDRLFEAQDSTHDG